MRSVVKVCTTSASKEVLVIETYKYGTKNKGQQSPYNKWPPGTKNGDSSSLGTPVRHLSVTQQTMDPTHDIHTERW